MKLIIGLIFVALVGGLGYIALNLQKDDNLNVDSFKSELNKHWDTAKEKSSELTEISKEKMKVLKEKWDEQSAKIDWEGIKTKLKISDKDLEEYKEFMRRAYSDEEVPEETMAKEEPVIKSKPSSEPAASQKPVVIENPPEPKKPTKLELMESKAREKLAEAKEMNRKAIPNQTGYKQNLRKSVKLYEAAREEYEALLKQRGLSKAQKASYEKTLSTINQQIYWGKKFDSI